VRLTFGRRHLRLMIEDNGVGPGHEQTAPRSQPALGIEGMRERVELLGGVFAMRARAKGGTRVVVTLPLEGRDHGDDRHGTQHEDPGPVD
jgi:signal transduction histidine kinase